MSKFWCYTFNMLETIELLLCFYCLPRLKLKRKARKEEKRSKTKG